MNSCCFLEVSLAAVREDRVSGPKSDERRLPWRRVSLAEQSTTDEGSSMFTP
ncbi:hypothetical protein HanRHA438_Chr02g0061991 [Helianthus annuus]|nr:hypothetical protein HanRHA438_Chr02g0061991 [Helianthus annuus]